MRLPQFIEARIIVLPLRDEYSRAFRAGEAGVLTEYDGFKLLQTEWYMAKRANSTKHGALLGYCDFIQ
jgi:hypothetical protein